MAEQLSLWRWEHVAEPDYHSGLGSREREGGRTEVRVQSQLPTHLLPPSRPYFLKVLTGPPIVPPAREKVLNTLAPHPYPHPTPPSPHQCHFLF